jgi:putative glutamine amidotransferase
MSRPVIGIATQTLPAVPGERPPCWIMGHRYVEALRAAGAVPWLIPLMPHDPDTLREIFSRLDGVFLTGGVDVDPARYHEPRHPLCGATDPARDAVEILLLDHATERGLPVLAVCRGIQVLNVALGGALVQDIPSQCPSALHHAPRNGRAVRVHDVHVAPGTRLAAAMVARRLQVNSSHHQAISRLAHGLRVSARAPDGIIEGAEWEGSDWWAVGVQWHPEELVETAEAWDRGLFATFAAQLRAD